MKITIPAKHRKYLEGKVKAGRFASVQAVVDAALSRMMENERDFEDLKKSLVKAAQDIDEGKGIPWSLHRVQARLLSRVAGREKRRRAS